MSVRRLADDAIQPTGFAFTAENENWARNKLKDYPEGRQASGVIPLLMRAQEQEGWVTKAAIEHVADMLDMPLIRVLEVATFYTQFQLAPVGKRAHIQVCGTTPCMLRGAGEIMDVCKRRISPNQFEVTEDGALSWEEVECQGACVNAPMVMIFRDSYEDLSPERMEEIIDAFESGNGHSVPAGPQIDRILSAPQGGPTSLQEDPEALAAAWRKEPEAEREAAEEQVATEAARPASHVSITSQTIQTPVDAALSRKAAQKDAKKRVEADTPAPKERADNLVQDAESNAIEPADMRQPQPEEIEAAPVGLSDAGTKEAGQRAASHRQLADNPPLTATTESATPPASGLAPVPSAQARAAREAAQAAPVDLDDPNRPEAIEKPAEPDNLRLISGIGPKIEGILHSLGIYTFAQIAAWEQNERDWVDTYLRFKGRIERDEWVRQAAALAIGREEYIRVFGKEPR